MPSVISISPVGDSHSAPHARPDDARANPSDITSFQAALSGNDGAADEWSTGVFDMVGAAASGLRKARDRVDAGFNNAVDTLDPWEMAKAVQAMSEYNHATQLATKLLNHAAQSVDQLTRGS